jgi:hypothetical protein
MKTVNGELSRAAAAFAGEIGACRCRVGRLVISQTNLTEENKK